MNPESFDFKTERVFITVDNTKYIIEIMEDFVGDIDNDLDTQLYAIEKLKSYLEFKNNNTIETLE